jgi:hypothetical protein
MKIVPMICLALLAFAVPAQAQTQSQQGQGQGLGPGHVRGMGNPSGSSPRNAAEEQQKARAVEKAYNETIKHIPTQKPADPWGKIRQ